MLKAARMDRLRQLPDREVKNVMRAFDEFASTPSRVGLKAECRSGISCSHRWIPVLDEAGRKYVEKRFEETDYDSIEFCENCGATCMRDGGVLFAYDTTFKFVDKTKKEER